MNTPSLRVFRKYSGIPWVSGGRDPAIGLDCWGLFMCVNRDFGREVPDLGLLFGQVLAIQREAARQQRLYWQPAPAPAPGVAVVMATHPEHPDILDHFGVFIDSRNLIHCVRGHGVVIDDAGYLGGTLCIRGLYQWKE